MFRKLESKGLVGLAYWDNGFKVMSAHKPIRVPADYKGLKMRIQSSKVPGDEMKALGSIPQVIAFSEVYQALQTGVVDGTENPPSNFYTRKMQEVQKYLALTNHGVIEYAVIVNKKFRDGLPLDVRTTLQGAMKDATKHANDIAKKENDDALEAVRKSGKTEILTLTPEQKAAMKKALVVVHKENESRVGKDIIAEVYRETGFKPWQLVDFRHGINNPVMPTNVSIQQGVDSLESRFLDPGVRRGDESNFNKLPAGERRSAGTAG